MLKNLEITVFRRQISNFLGVYRHLIGVIFSCTQFLQIFFVPFLGFVGVAAYMGVFSLIAQFVASRGDAGNNIFSLFFSNESTTALFVLAAGILTLLLVAAASTYLSSVQAFKIGRNVHIHMISRTVVALGSLHRTAEKQKDLSQIKLQRYFSRDALQSGLAAEALLNISLSSAYVIGAVATLLYWEPWISLGLFVLASILIPGVYLVSRQTLTNAAQFYAQFITDRAKAIRHLIGQFDTTTLRQPTDQDAKTLIQSQSMQRYLDAFDFNRLAPSRMAAVIGIFLAFTISSGVLIFGLLVLNQTRSWSALLVYVGSLIVLMRGLQGLMSQFAVLNRLYPQISGLIALLDAAEAHDASRELPSTSVPESLLTNVAPEIPHSKESLVVNRAEPVLLVIDTPLRRHTFHKFVEPFIQPGADSKKFLETAAILAQPLEFEDGTSLAEAILGPGYSSSQLNELKCLLTKFGKAKDLQLVVEQIHLSNGQRPKTQATRCLLSIAAIALPNPPHIAFIDHSLLRGHGPRAFVDLCENPIAEFTIVVSKPSEAAADLPSDMGTLVVHEGRFIGAGDVAWWRENREDTAMLADRPESDDSLSEADLM